MTLHQNIRAAFDNWVRDHEGTACADALKTAFITDQLYPVYEDLGKIPPSNIHKFISRNMRNSRGVVIDPEKTKKGLKKHTIGSENSNSGKRRKQSNTIINKKFNPINNPINHQKKQDQLRAQHALELQNVKYNDEAYLGIPAATVIAENIVKNFSIFESIMTDESISFYIFYTARVAAIEGVEWAAFLSGRSGYTMDSERKPSIKTK